MLSDVEFLIGVLCQDGALRKIGDRTATLGGKSKIEMNGDKES